eukprot:4390033-Amphidinium_carterae.1
MGGEAQWTTSAHFRLQLVCTATWSICDCRYQHKEAIQTVSLSVSCAKLAIACWVRYRHGASCEVIHSQIRSFTHNSVSHYRVKPYEQALRSTQVTARSARQWCHRTHGSKYVTGPAGTTTAHTRQGQPM